MYYKIENGRIEETTIEKWEENQQGIVLFTTKEWEQVVQVRASYLWEQAHDNTRFCKLERYSDFLFGTFHIPSKGNQDKHLNFVFYILENELIFIDDTNLVKNSVEKILSGNLRKEYTLDRFLYDLLVSLIGEDILSLAEIEKDITKMEERILAGDVEGFNYQMLILKKSISRLYRYYSQLTDLGQSLFENEMNFFGKDKIAIFRVFSERASRLQAETQVLREYAMQVQEVYQSEIEIRQNDVMKVLTIVTTIFLPLTLITGWYGMNFINMPELEWPYGYHMVIGLSIIIVISSLWIFKKKM